MWANLWEKVATGIINGLETGFQEMIGNRNLRIYIGTFGNYGEAHEPDPRKLDGRFNM